MRQRYSIKFAIIIILCSAFILADDTRKPAAPEKTSPATPSPADNHSPAAPSVSDKPSPAIPAAAPAAETAIVESPAAAAVRERANLFMKSKCNNQTDVCYTLLTKNIRSKLTMVQFIQSSTVTIYRYQLEDIIIDPANSSHATVHVIYDTSMLGYSFKNRKIAQQWFFEDNNWFMELEIGNPFRMGQKKAAEAGKKPNIDPETLKKIQEMAKKLRTDPHGGPPIQPGPAKTQPPAQTDPAKTQPPSEEPKK